MSLAFEKKLKVNRKLDLHKLPQHIAIIMDGNGRWAKRRGLPRSFGHRAGFENIKRIVEHVYKLGIPYITFFTFSTENWKRPQDEIDGIFNLVRDHLNNDKEVQRFLDNDIKLVTMGDLTKLPSDLHHKIVEVAQKTQNAQKLTLNLAINYGGRDEILKAINLAIKDGKVLNSSKEFEKYLYSKDLPDPDFVIRTSGELRISNFMLYQMAYSEFYFTKTYWPDFGPKQLELALIDYQKRQRRFGAVK
ncbi:MAG: di-trans,poly-cis-decaprenylcistransferase [Clostridia bacterium]|nr:di-trans,poly-cis-decaprenylcistransferase [Clostridia bacterium]